MDDRSDDTAQARASASSLSGSVESALADAQIKHTQCVLRHSWTFTVFALAASVPWSVYVKSYTPFAGGVAVGSTADYARGWTKCAPERAEVARLEKLAESYADSK